MDYKAGSQTWDIEQGWNGMMYFANNEGLLEFNGSSWAVYPLPNISILRSIEPGEDHRLYAGGFNEIGYYVLKPSGGAVFHSLTYLIPKEYRDFDEVWKIYIHPDGVIFQTFRQIMIYNSDTIQIIKAPSSFHFSFMVDNEYYVNDMKTGLLRYAMGKLYPLIGTDNLKGKQIWGMVSHGNELLIATASEGIFLYNGNSIVPVMNSMNDFLKKNQIYSLIKLHNEKLAFGTIQNGLLICDSKFIPLETISMDDDLQNNTILSMSEDNYENLWLGTDHGIDYVFLNSPLQEMSSNYGLGTGYAAVIHHNRLYLGTNKGLFVTDIKNPLGYIPWSKKLQMINGTQGQVWSLQIVDDQLFCGHNYGIFLINDTIAHKISDIPGVWTFKPVPGNRSKIIGGTYKGLSLFEMKNGKWSFFKLLKGFSESSKSIVFDNDGSLWMAHGYKGVFHIFFNNNYDSILKVDFYNSKNTNLPSHVYNMIMIDNNIYITSSEGLIRYAKESNDFYTASPFGNELKDKHLTQLKSDNEGNFWYFTDNSAGVLRRREDGNYNNITLPFKQLEGHFVKGFEFVYPYNPSLVLFGTENGFTNYYSTYKKNYHYQFNTYILSIKTQNPDSVFINTNENKEKIFSLDYNNKRVKFYFSANDFENVKNIEYSTFLDGYDNDWSEWQKGNEKEYTNLYEGRYTFQVKARNLYGTEIQSSSFLFEISPPFRRSAWAYLIYLLLLILFIMFVLYIFKKRYDRTKANEQLKQQELFRKKEEQLQREKLEKEREIIKVRNQVLRMEMKQKDKELANATMQKLQNNEMLIELREELKKLANLSVDESHRHEVSHLVRKINKQLDSENQWKVFESYFDSVHEEFLKKVKSAYPSLSPRELKLCAYLRMNISSKEISVLMNISVRGVEISRYRLRKKIGLPRSVNLTEFIMSF